MKWFDVRVYLTDWRYGGKPWRVVRVLAHNASEANRLAMGQVSHERPYSWVGCEVVE